MNEEPLAQLKSAVLTNVNFRRQVLDDPANALQSVGIEPTDDLLSLIAKLKQDLEAIGQILGVEDIEFFS